MVTFSSFVLALACIIVCTSALTPCKPGAPAGWYRRPGSVYCYKLSSSSDKRSWWSARSICKNLDSQADLVSIESLIEMNWLRTHLDDDLNAGSASIWTSARKILGSWKWQHGNPTSETWAWQADEPNGSGTCMVMDRTSAASSVWEWYDRNCFTQYRYMCEIARSNLNTVLYNGQFVQSGK